MTKKSAFQCNYELKENKHIQNVNGGNQTNIKQNCTTIKKKKRQERKEDNEL